MLSTGQYTINVVQQFLGELTIFHNFKLLRKSFNDHSILPIKSVHSEELKHIILRLDLGALKESHPYLVKGHGIQGKTAGNDL